LAGDRNVKNPSVFTGSGNWESIKPDPELGVAKLLRVPAGFVADFVTLASVSVELGFTDDLFTVLVTLVVSVNTLDKVRDLGAEVIGTGSDNSQQEEDNDEN
jgi:hypothetical protein